MKIKQALALLIVSVLASACMSGSNSDTVYTQPQSQTAVVSTTTVTATISNPSTWARIPMHYRVLKGQPHVWNEQGGARAFAVTQYASAGGYSLNVASTAGLVPAQLITYRGVNGNYYSVQIQRINGTSLSLSTPLEQAVYAGENAWNFYEDGAHPNWAGSFAIADFSIDYLGWNRLNQGKHVLLGDSWFSRQSLYQRLQSRLTSASISNKGVGGHNAADLLARFDRDVRWQNPNYVWIMTGTNDYWQNRSASTYKSNMRELINAVRSIGATPIIFDSSVGPLNYGSDWKTKLSQSYVVSMDQLVSEY